ncbi:LOW QUALITY PROTEIN: integrin alpha-6-like [Pristis pectinata]|uniref:LOW QUALITY PROTEIN: integrin alpha-6-like n=1 Tax=Pristis pectinata TaxID=685728 RepID=UPI00223D15D2|nr:LOW QUALITY PROTEIN: integrin alpha-6-like [Pristis pectinata]
MAAAEQWLLMYLSLFSLKEWTLAFNLDTENVIKKTGEHSSLFGFSLAMHQQLVPSDEIMLLVGAPKAKGFPEQKAKVTGGLYKCPVTDREKDCERAIFDNDVDVSQESKDNQWMGVSVESQGIGGKVMVCAHRYEQRRLVNKPEESRDVTGQCYILSQDLVFREDETDINVKLCAGRPQGHEKFGICQQGVASAFTKGANYSVYGAPGAYNWKGIVHVESRDIEEINFDDGPYEVGDENIRDEKMVPVPANSYLGFSLDSGKGITSQDTLTIVSGAPRANHTGAVLFLKMEKSTRNLMTEYILNGEGLASSFGYDIAVVDLNRDRWLDLVVGAPQFFDREAEIGGAAYVYINEKGDWNKANLIRLNGTKDSMFGLAVENIGDINQDGYPDIAVGAPYDNKGKVFIYHGSGSGINTKPAQILEAKDSSVNHFGYSLAGNMDLDGNGYPDVAVGSLSDAVFMYRARPVIKIEKSVTTEPKDIDINKNNCPNRQGICVTVRACFKYTAYFKDFNPKINVGYRLEADTERKKLGLQSRVFFIGQGNEQENQFLGNIELEAQNKEKCIVQHLKFQDNIKDKLRPVPISVGVEIKQSRRKKRQNSNLIDLPPVLDQSEPLVTQLQFMKEGCGDDNICQSNLQLKYRFGSRIEKQQDKFDPLLMEDNVPVFKLSDQNDIVLEITVSNKPSDPKNQHKDGDDAHEAHLIATFPDTLTYSAYRVSTLNQDKVLCTANQNGSQAQCELGNPLKRGSEVTFHLIMSTAGITLNTRNLSINLQLETTSEQVNRLSVATARVVIELLLSVVGAAKPSQVYFGGSEVGESAMKTEEDIGSLIQYEFRIINLGRSLKTLDDAWLQIMWPKEIYNGKWLLYLMKMNSKGINYASCQPQDEINKLNLKELPIQTRKRRELEGNENNPGLISSFLSDKRKYITLECGQSAKCVNIKCPLSGLDSNAFLVLHSRLWNTTFLEEFSKLNYLDIIVKAMISVESKAKNIVVKNSETKVRVTVFPEKTVSHYFGIPWWIIFVAILVGILLLALLIFLLWKCGFFKRSRYEDSVPRYHAVRIRKERQPFQDEKLSKKQNKKQWMTTWQENESYS